MDQRRPVYAPHPPPPAPPPHPHADHPHRHPPAPPQSYAQPPPSAHHHYQYPRQHQQEHPHPSPHQQGPPLQHPQQYPAYQGPSPNLPPGQGPSLPPIQTTAYAPPPSASASEQHNLSTFRHPSGPLPPPPPPPSSSEQREGVQEYHPQYNHNRSGHGTPAPVNRSYSHDSGHQRSPVTPAGLGPGAYPPTAASDGPPQHHMEHGGHPGYPPTNGVPHGLPPPPPHESHSHPMTPMMDSHYQYGPPGQSIYSASSYGPTAASMYGPKRKQMRATQACEQCRQRKQKCDEGSPCSFCKENGLSCQYRDTPPAKTDKNMEKLLSYMESHSAGLQNLTSKIDQFEARLRHVEQNGQQTSNTHHSSANAALEVVDPAEVAHPKRKNQVEDHRTAPHKLLLLWPTVRPLLIAARVGEEDSYVMAAEDRGILRIWTRGEGIDEYDGTHAGGPASPARSDESNDGAVANSPHNGGLWGVGFSSQPGSETRRSEPYGAGGLKPNGDVDLDAKTIHELYESYMRHMHIMHPFLDKRRLKKMIDIFIKRYGTGTKNRAGFAVGQSDPEQRPLKRQRSNGSTANIGSGSDADPRLQPERSPGNAIIYLVLALGKICMFKDALPAIVRDSKLSANNVISHQLSGNPGFTASSPIDATIKPSPTSPKMTPTTQPTPPSEAGARIAESRSPRLSTDGVPGSSPYAGSRNLDVVPGIAYYAKAAEILGDQGDGNDLVHAQMFLLAGLYKGQLARVKESMSWLTMAGRAIITLLDRYKLYNENYWTAFGDKRMQHEESQKKIKDTRQSLIVLASWSCLQLESDILAELKLPSSGIQEKENLLLMPHKVDENAEEEEMYKNFQPDGRQEDDDNILLFYTAQLYLRKRLNQIHKEIYGPDSLSLENHQVAEMLSTHEDTLETWRNYLPASLKWEDPDPPPADILAARLRAKYWGAKYVSTRPFLDYALHILPHLRDGKSIDEAARDGYGYPRDKADVHMFKAIRSHYTDGEVWDACKRCINAAMHSTVAFDGVQDRLIVTNIHGTAHAQFGNMLVVAATFNSDFGRPLIEPQVFKDNLDRTITFLRRLAPISPTCELDCGILEKFKSTLFPTADELPHIYHNEGIVEGVSATTSFDASP